jgi:hypothetical protein
LDTPSLPIQCSFNSDHIDALYNPVVGINIMSNEAHDINPNYKTNEESFRTHCPQSRSFTHPTNPGRRNLGSFELLCLPHMGLRLVDRTTFRRLLYEGQTGKINIYFGKKFQFPMSILIL